MIYLYFDLAPIPKGRPCFRRIGAHVGTYTPAKTKQYEGNIATLSAAQYKLDPLDCPLKIEISFFIKPPKTVRRKYPSVKPDLDNLTKSVLDGMEKGGVFKNDSLIISLSCIKRYRAEAGIEVRIYPVKE